MWEALLGSGTLLNQLCSTNALICNQFANFHSVNISIGVEFTLPTQCHWTQNWGVSFFYCLPIWGRKNRKEGISLYSTDYSHMLILSSALECKLPSPGVFPPQIIQVHSRNSNSISNKNIFFFQKLKWKLTPTNQGRVQAPKINNFTGVLCHSVGSLCWAGKGCLSSSKIPWFRRDSLVVICWTVQKHQLQLQFLLVKALMVLH